LGTVSFLLRNEDNKRKGGPVNVHIDLQIYETRNYRCLLT